MKFHNHMLCGQQIATTPEEQKGNCRCQENKARVLGESPSILNRWENLETSCIH
jgi:hypothetical protein